MAHYRAKVKAVADDMGIVGEARNLKDGTVRIIAEGEDTKLTEFIDRLKMKEYITDVQGMDIKYEEPTGKYTSFERKGEDIPDEDADMLTVMKSFDKKGEKMVGLMESMNKRLGSIDDKQDQMINMQGQTLEKQDKMLDKQDQTIEIIKEGNKKLLDKQDQTIEELDSFHKDTVQEFNTLNTKYGKIAENMEKILNEMKEERKEFRNFTERIIKLILSQKK